MVGTGQGRCMGVQGCCGGRALTSLNSWIWACSNMEKTLEEPRWACLVAAALPRVPAFLLACNTVGGEGSSPGPPKDAPMHTPEHSQESRSPLPALEATSPGPASTEAAALPPSQPVLTILSLWQPGATRGPQTPLCVSLITWTTK